MDTFRGSTSVSSVPSGLVRLVRPALRIVAALVVLAGLLAGALRAQGVGAQPALIGGIEIRVHSCPDDLDATGFFQHLTQCTSERGLYGVALGVNSPGTGGPLFEYSQPDDTGRAALMTWTNVAIGTVTITEVAPDPIRPSVAFCSLQPGGGGPLTLDGEEVEVVDGVLSIQLDIGDVLMCDWYRFPGGVTAGDEGDGGDGEEGDGEGDEGDGGGDDVAGGVVFDPATGEADEELSGSQIFVRVWDCGDAVPERPEALDIDTADGLAELTDACAPSADAFPFALGDVVEEGGEDAAAEEEDAGDEQPAGEAGEFQGIVAEDGTIVDEEGGPDEAVAGGPSGEGDGEGANQGIVAGDEGDAEGAEVGDGDGDGDGEGAVGVYPPVQAGGDAYRGWNGLAAGGYTILETVPGEYDEPLVICDGIFAGAEAGANIFELTAIDGAVVYDLSEGELLLCDWFNRSAEGDGGDGEGDGEGGDGEDGAADAENNDRDRDGLLNTEEADYGTDPDDEDTDDDDVVDGDEFLAGTDPFNPDTDGDTFTDSQELYQLGTDPLVYDLGPLDDADGDFLTNEEEVNQYGTDPFNSDSDGDLVNDYLEVVTYGSDPWDEDTDDDGRDDGGEVDAGSDPTVPQE